MLTTFTKNKQVKPKAIDLACSKKHSVSEHGTSLQSQYSRYLSFHAIHTNKLCLAVFVIKSCVWLKKTTSNFYSNASGPFWNHLSWPVFIWFTVIILRLQMASRHGNGPEVMSEQRQPLSQWIISFGQPREIELDTEIFIASQPSLTADRNCFETSFTQSCRGR